MDQVFVERITLLVVWW